MTRLVAFLRSRQGGGMLVGGALAISLLAGIGGTLTNYAWREAQSEELRSAIRAAVSAAGPLLGGAGGAMDAAIEERVGSFVLGLVPGLSLERVTVDHDVASGVTTVTVEGQYAFQSLWEIGPEDAEAVAESVAAKLETERYEVAVALDISGSMLEPIPGETPGTQVVKLDSLKMAMHYVADVMQDATGTTPGSLLVSIVPFSSAVNVADTATAGPGADRGRSPAKERYVRMLAGPHATLADTLAAARNTGGHWVDAFHHYGVGSDPGPIGRMSLPQDLLEDRDWNLRKTDVAVDIAAQIPGLATWTVDDEDFWNGCVVARWGAYWLDRSRPAGWSASDPDNWPARKAVPGWSPAAAGLPGDTPLHLSDAPPDSADPNTLFTAYSWPDSRVGGAAAHRLQTVMASLLDRGPSGLDVGLFGQTLPSHVVRADNDWSYSGTRGGAALCPPSPVTPLTDDLQALREAVTALRTTEPFRPCTGCRTTVAATYLNLGIVWGLRTLSPLWEGVWGVRDTQGAARPGVPCAPGETAGGCDPLLNKSILIISDGASFPGWMKRSRLGRDFGLGNPTWEDGALCNSFGDSFLQNYQAAAIENNAPDFNGHFVDFLDAGRFGGARMGDVLDAFHLVGDRWPDDPPTRRDLRRQALEGLTPWQLFRGLDAGATDTLMDEDNAFGFDRRPAEIGHLCRPSSAYGPYGRLDDRVFVGNTTTLPVTPLAPVADVAPFNLAGLPEALTGDGSPGSGDFGWPAGLVGLMAKRLDDWFAEACRLAGERRVRVNAIFIGDLRRDRAQIATLERCVDAAGGVDGQDDVFVTPTATALQSAFTELFTIRRNLRFLN